MTTTTVTTTVSGKVEATPRTEHEVNVERKKAENWPNVSRRPNNLQRNPVGA